MVKRLILALALLYCASPVDVLPDFIPIVGQADDLLAVIAGVLPFFRKERK